MPNTLVRDIDRGPFRKAGLLRKTDADLIVFPFDAIHVDFTLRAA